jgi:hypothetical protein
LAWDLFNEPSNSGYMDAVVPLLKAVFAWAREANPDQPLTSGLWNDHPMSNDVMLDNADVVTFHDYDAPDKLEAMVRDVFDMRPAAIIERLDLRRPIYKRTAAYGHFGRTDGDGFTWENVDPYADELRRAAG